jgi:hypothetical protein
MYLVVVAPHHALYRYFGVAKRKGYSTLALTHDKTSCLAYEKHYHQMTNTGDASEIDELAECRVLSPDSILAALKPYRGQVAGIVPGDESVVSSTFAAAAALGFDGAKPEDVPGLHIEKAMKQRLAERGVHALDEAGGGFEVSAQGYVCGDRVSVLNTCAKTTPELFVLAGDYVPSHLGTDDRANVERLAAECALALGVRNSVFHAKIQVRDGVAYVIECASRPPDRFITDLIDLAYRIDLCDISIDLATGKQVKVQSAGPEHYFAQLPLYAREAGIFTGVAGFDQLRGHDALRTWFLDVELGDRVEKLTRYGAMVLQDDTPEGVRAKAEWAAGNVWLRVARHPDAAPGQLADPHR